MRNTPPPTAGAAAGPSDVQDTLELAAPGNAVDPLELDARGNAVVEGRLGIDIPGSFFARAEQMTYTQAKDLIILKGTSKADARLWRQLQVGGPRSEVAARRIFFWTDGKHKGKVELDSAKRLQGMFYRIDGKVELDPARRLNLIPLPATQSTTEGQTERIEYLRVDFERAADGHLHERWLTFHGQVRAVYGTVVRWDAELEHEGPLGPDTVRLKSDTLTVIQTKRVEETASPRAPAAP